MPQRKNPESSPRRYVVGISGASGAVYATRFVERLVRDPAVRVDLISSTAGLRVLRGELDPVGARKGSKAAKRSGGADRLMEYFDLSPTQRARVSVIPGADIGAGPASGTYRTAGMIVVPCSMNTVACIAHGIQNNLLTRAAAVTLKEGRPLMLVPRETPLGLVELRAMTAAAEAGAIVLPANPGFYHRPKTVDDLVDFVVQKMMDRLGLEYEGGVRWSGERG
jgi:flavin prenyltransferase